MLRVVEDRLRSYEPLDERVEGVYLRPSVLDAPVFGEVGRGATDEPERSTVPLRVRV
ncbi:MAG: hypothetical protein WD423_06135 [Rhodothermales bacterium]